MLLKEILPEEYRLFEVTIDTIDEYDNLLGGRTWALVVTKNKEIDDIEGYYNLYSKCIKLDLIFKDYILPVITYSRDPIIHLESGNGIIIICNDAYTVGEKYGKKFYSMNDEKSLEFMTMLGNLN